MKKAVAELPGQEVASLAGQKLLSRSSTLSGVLSAKAVSNSCAGA
jgi:hypothetical protein